jgi:hypothetical protein
MPRVSKKLLAGEAWMFVIITRISSGRAVQLSIKKCPLIYAPWAIKIYSIFCSTRTKELKCFQGPLAS